MDAFYASVEQRDFPELKGKPLIVGGRPEGRGVVAAASYEARKYGVRSAMSCRKAAKLCPDAVFVPPRFEVYKQVSRQIRDIFSRYTDIIEPLSLDEAYLDVSQDKQGIGSAIEIASAIRTSIREELQLTASAGISVNKFVAKIASDLNKPNGQTFIGPSRIERFMERLPVEQFYGVGKVTAAKMQSLGILTGKDLKQRSEADLVRLFGKQGAFFYQIVRGIDQRPVKAHRQMKSVSVEETFSTDLHKLEDLQKELDLLALRLYKRMEKHGLRMKTLTLKIRFSDFSTLTRSRSVPELIAGQGQIQSISGALLEKVFSQRSDPVRLLGINASNLSRDGTPEKTNRQLSLF